MVSVPMRLTADIFALCSCIALLYHMRVIPILVLWDDWRRASFSLELQGLLQRQWAWQPHQLLLYLLVNNLLHSRLSPWLRACGRGVGVLCGVVRLTPVIVRGNRDSDTRKKTPYALRYTTNRRTTRTALLLPYIRIRHGTTKRITIGR